MKVLKILFVLALFFVFAGSSYSQTSTDTTKTKKKTSTIKKVYKSYNGCKKNSGSCTYFELDYQIVKSGNARSEINQAIQDSLLKSVNIWDNRKASDFKEAAANFIKEYESSMAQPTNGASWYLETDAKINSNRKNVLSYKVTQSMYTGGAHPNTYVVYYNFDKTTGKQIALADIFGANFDAKLNKVIDAKYRKVKGLKATDNLQETVGLFENKITYARNFAIEKKGLRFYYNTYEIAAYVDGPTDLFVTWKDLAEILPDASYYSK